MQKINFLNEQQQASSFTIVYTHGQTVEIVEVHAIDMDGWMLYECFALPSYNVIYFSWDENAKLPEWINMENETLGEEISILCTELIKYIQPAA